MNRVFLSGELICRDEADVAIVCKHLPLHLALTRAEPGCIRFDVQQTNNPLIWRVDEEFVDEVAFAEHQVRTTSSEWGTATAGMMRDYHTTEEQ